MNPVFGASKFLVRGAGCHAPSKPFFPRPAKRAETGPMPVEERNQGSTDSRSIPQMSGSLPNVFLPPLLEPRIRSTFESLRMCPDDGLYRVKDK